MVCDNNLGGGLQSLFTGDKALANLRSRVRQLSLSITKSNPIYSLSAYHWPNVCIIGLSLIAQYGSMRWPTRLQLCYYLWHNIPYNQSSIVFTKVPICWTLVKPLSDIAKHVCKRLLVGNGFYGYCDYLNGDEFNGLLIDLK